VDGEEPAPSGRGPRPGIITLAVLLGGLLLTVLLSRGGFHFLFLPIILPFGLGGGRWLRRAFAPLHGRALQLDERGLSLVSRSPWGGSRVRSIGTYGGMHVAVIPSRLWLNGVESVEVRIVGADGALSVPVEGAENARRLRHRIGSMLHSAGIESLGSDATLQGGAVARREGPTQEIEWQGDGERGSGSGVLPLVLFGALALGVTWLFTRQPGISLAPLVIPLILFLMLAMVLPLGIGAFGGGPRRTAVVTGPEGWSLRVASRARTLASTGGPGRLTAGLVAADHTDPFGVGIVTRGRALELRAGGEIVGTVGTELSEPELRWVAGRLSDA